MNKQSKLIVFVICELISLGVFCLFGFIYLIGGFLLMKAEYGYLVYIIYFILLALLFLIPLLTFKLNKVWGFVIYLCLLIVLFGGTGLSNRHINNKYADFSKTEWVNKPAVRQIMYNSLKDNEDFYSSSRSDIKDMLGAPDEKSEKWYSYKTIPGEIVITFDNDVVSSIYWDSPIG